jgi:hypothetical protein
MKRFASLLVVPVALAALIPSLLPAQAPAPAKKQFAILFFESPQGFADRSNANSSKYWQSWGGYIQGLYATGRVQSGSALLPPTVGVRVAKSGESSLSARGPALSGYIVVSGESVAEVSRLAKESPALESGGHVEIRELLPMTEPMGQGR